MEVTNMWTWSFYPPAHDTGLQTCNRPLILTCDRLARCLSSVAEWQPEMKAAQGWNRSVFEYPWFWGAYVNLYSPLSAFPLHHCYHHINAFYFIISSFKPQQFYLHWIFYDFNPSSGKKLSCVFSYWVFAEDMKDAACTQTGHELPLSVMVLLLPTQVCLIPQLTCSHCSAPNSLDMTLLQSKI